jgi:asparagine synthetase B (glutamine-hydrolysing)
MVRQMVPISQSTQAAVDAPMLALRARVASWTKGATAQDPNTETQLFLMGHAWRNRQQVDGSTLLNDYLHEGQSAFMGLGGSFAVLVWQPRDETLLIATDRLATKKIYFWKAGDTILLSTELRALLGHPLSPPREMDTVSVEQFLITSHLVDTRSLIKGVSLLEPGTITRITRGGLDTKHYWRPSIVPANDDGLDAWADRLAEVLAPAVEARCDQSPLLLPLSGGLDSRSIAAFIPPSMAVAAKTCSFGHAHCYDVRYGRGVSNALGAKFQQLSIPKDFYRSYLGPVQTICDGEVSIEALPMYRLIEAGSLGQTTLMGFLGDALSGGHLVGLPGSMDATAGMDAIWRKKYQSMGFSEQQLEDVLLPEHYRAVKGSTRAIMRAALETADADTLDEKALVVELQHRQSRYISYFGRLLSTHLHVEFPFLDIDVMDTFLAMPLNHRLGQRAYRRMLARHAPRLASVPENKTQRPVAYTDRHGLSPVAVKPIDSYPLPSWLQWRLNKARRGFNDFIVRASGGWLGPHDRSYYVHHDENIRCVDPSWYRSMLLESPYAADWFNLPALEKLLDEHMALKQDHSIRINNVIALLAWYKGIRD